jgi:MoaA/NifB/PqqE/SkfB family radical SAM enzyme
MDGLIAVTYRCNAHCVMCNTWCNPSQPADEITAADLRSLPSLEFANVTGGEPFMRDDLVDLVEVLVGKAKRVVVSTNGYYTDRVLALARRFPHIGVRVSLEGLPAANDQLRGLPDGFDHGLRTILRLRAFGLRDIGFGITLSDRNADDLMELYELADAMGVEFATAAIHNSYYFHKFDNAFDDPDHVARKLEEVAQRLLRTRRPKSWFRAWFNMGLANYVRGGDRLLPCGVAEDLFFVDPFGEVRPCNAMEETMGSLKQRSFDEIWTSPEARLVRSHVATCTRNCWMIGSVSPAMKKNLRVPAAWVLRAKLTRTTPAVHPPIADRPAEAAPAAPASSAPVPSAPAPASSGDPESAA